MRMWQNKILIEIILIHIIVLQQFIKADPFTYQNDPRILQISVIDILTGTRTAACQSSNSLVQFFVEVTFAQPFQSLIPQVALSIQHFKGSSNTQTGFYVQAPKNKITYSGFEIEVNCQMDSAANQLTTLKVQYIATIQDNIEMFSKQYNAATLAGLGTSSLYREFSEIITFSSPKSEIPSVYAFITGFNLIKGTDKRFIIKAEITDIKLTRFTSLLSTNLRCMCKFISIQYIAFWSIEASHNLLPTTTNNDARKDPVAFPYFGFYSDYLNTNQTAIDVFFGISQFDLGTFNPTSPLLADASIEVEIKPPTFTGKEYLFSVGSQSGTRNYETFIPWVIFLLKRCPNNEYLHSNYLCSLLCPFGTYKDIVKNVGVGICSNCHLTCKECSGPGINQCLLCSFPSRTLVTNTCPCSNGYYQGSIQQKDCQQCSSKCETCLNSAENCQSCKGNRELSNSCKCPKGYWDQGVFEVCPSCYRTCNECTNGEENSCTSCKIGYSLQNGQCICAKGKYDDLTKNTCSNCHYSCNTCNGQSDQDCLSCKTDTYRQLVQGKQCLCQVGYHEENNVCVKDTKLQCVPYCEVCQDDKFCSQCQQGRILVFNTCVCPEGFYHNSETKTCVQCDYTCKGCSGSSKYDCISCFSDRVFDNGSCSDTSSSKDTSINIPLLVFICIFTVLLLIFIPLLMRWTYHLRQKVWLRKRALAEFLDGRAKEREERIQRGEADIIIHEPIVMTDPGDENLEIPHNDQNIEESYERDQQNNYSKSPYLSNASPQQRRNSDLQILSPQRSPHITMLQPNSTNKMNDSYMKSPSPANQNHILSQTLQTQTFTAKVNNTQHILQSRYQQDTNPMMVSKNRISKLQL